jgi:phage repressor protein C with HTH and peptisase S24 domain
MVEESELQGFPARLRELIGEDSVSRFASEVGLGDNLVRKYLDGATPGLDKVVRISEAKGISLEWLATGVGDKNAFIEEGGKRVPKQSALRMRRRKSDDPVYKADQVADREMLEADDGAQFILLPRYDVKVSAGGGSFIHSEQIVNHLSFRADWWEREVGIPPKFAMLVEVRGDSMIPDLHDGDLAAVDTRVSKLVDDGIYVLRYADSLRIKRVHRRLDGKLEIKSSNEEMYKPELITEAEAAEQIQIIGAAKTAIPRIRRLP